LPLVTHVPPVSPVKHELSGVHAPDDATVSAFGKLRVCAKFCRPQP